jgi:hypothetical protein
MAGADFELTGCPEVVPRGSELVVGEQVPHRPSSLAIVDLTLAAVLSPAQCQSASLPRR